MTEMEKAEPSIWREPRGLAIVPYSLLGALPFSMVLFMPMFVGGFVTDFGLSERQAGTLAAINIAGFGLATMIAFLWVSRVSIRAMVTVATVLFVAANGLSAGFHGFGGLVALRFLEGVAAGTLSSGIVVSISKLKNADRQFGIWLAVQLLYGTIGFLLIPSIFNEFGTGGGFGAIALLGVLFAPLARWLPSKVQAEQAPPASSQSGSSGHPGWGVASLLAFYVGLNVVWAYLERLGANAGLSLQAISWALSMANFAGLAGATIVALAASRLNRAISLTIGLTITAFSALALLGRPTTIHFAAATSVYLFGWCFLIPLMLAAISDADKTGRYVAHGNAAIGVGLALGPYVGAQLINPTKGYSLILYVGWGLMLLSAVLILPIARQRAGASVMGESDGERSHIHA